MTAHDLSSRLFFTTTRPLLAAPSLWLSTGLAIVTVIFVEFGIRSEYDSRTVLAVWTSRILATSRKLSQTLTQSGALEATSQPYVDTDLLRGSWQDLLVAGGKALAVTFAAAAAGSLYSQVAYAATAWAYRRGILKRHFPLPTDTNLWTTFSTLCSFAIMPAIWACIFSPARWHWQMPNVLRLFLLNLLNMVIQDIWFNLVHRTLHTKLFYRAFHESHHEAQKEINVADLFMGEFTESLLSIGAPWLLWVVLYGRTGSTWTMIVPFSYNLYTNLMGHSGYASHPFLLLLHPLQLAMVLLFRHHLLSPGDHSAHHLYYRVNYGMYFRDVDKWLGTYKRLTLPAHDFAWWRDELRRQLAASGKPYRSRRIITEGDFDLPGRTPWGM